MYDVDGMAMALITALGKQTEQLKRLADLLQTVMESDGEVCFIRTGEQNARPGRTIRAGDIPRRSVG